MFHLPRTALLRCISPRSGFAGWWQRVGATIVDVLIFWVFLLPSIVVSNTGGASGLSALLYVAGAVAFVTFYCRRVGSQGQSWGMSATGYKIVDERTGAVIGTGRAVGRYFARLLSALPCYLGFLWPLWDSENRTFHDMIVRTRAVRV